ncbi:MAG: primase [Microbacteriaceae bacterium]|jgi:DNA primase|nr:primase [Microbacteriaceae bacterium]MDQ1528056.1 primase [Microbacteriaceae bacterium]MDQ1578368.1 primase [Microbacteriaceae bacterium]
MPGLIRRNDIDEVRARINIVDIVGDYVTLKGAGVGSLKGLCPFHDERSPSFHVRPQVGRYHCFGCGEDGDVFSFLQKMDHTTFTEAVERMAARLGYELHYEDGGQANADHGNRARLLAANQAAAEFFVAQLTTPEAEPGRKFLGERGFDASAAERFGIGFAPKSYDALSKHLKTLGFTDAELLAAGLTGEGDRGFYDRFRGRLVWPIRDVTGQTLGFGARKLLDDDQGPKYLNTPETPIYHKSQVLYGLDLAKRDISRGRQVVVVEGYTDVMACHLAGITTAVATCGTAFGVDHIKMIRRVLGDVANDDSRGLGEVVFTFDPDEAGQKAASRAFSEEQRFAAQTFVAVAPDGLDPCDLRLNRGDDAVRRLIRAKKPMFEFMVRRVLASHNLDTVEGRVAALRAAAPVVAGIRDQALNIGYVRNLAGWLGMEPREVAQAVAAARGTAQRAQPTRDGGRMESGQQSHTEPERVQHGPSLVQLPTDPATRLERDAVMVMLQQPAAVGRALVERASQVTFSNPSLAVVKDGIAASMDDFDSPHWLDRVIDEVPGPFSTLVKELGVAPIPEKDNRELAIYCQGVTTDLIGKHLLHQKSEMLGNLQRTDAAAEPARYREIQKELVSIEAERRALRAEQ